LQLVWVKIDHLLPPAALGLWRRPAAPSFFELHQVVTHNDPARPSNKSGGGIDGWQFAAGDPTTHLIFADPIEAGNLADGHAGFETIVRITGSGIERGATPNESRGVIGHDVLPLLLLALSASVPSIPLISETCDDSLTTRLRQVRTRLGRLRCGAPSTSAVMSSAGRFADELERRPLPNIRTTLNQAPLGPNSAEHAD
jgi:hypothetical protein